MEKKIKNTTKNKIEDLCSPLGGTHGYKDFLTYFHSRSARKAMSFLTGAKRPSNPRRLKPMVKVPKGP